MLVGRFGGLKTEKGVDLLKYTVLAVNFSYWPVAFLLVLGSIALRFSLVAKPMTCIIVIGLVIVAIIIPLVHAWRQKRD